MNSCFFSDRYYREPTLFLDKIPYGKASESDSSEYAVILPSGTIATEMRATKYIPHYIRECFGPRHNAELAKIDEKLCLIMEQMKRSHSPEYGALQAEVRKYGKVGFNCLRENISNIRLILREKNRRSLFVKMVFCIVNMIRWLFGIKIPSLPHYRFGDVTILEYDELFQKLRNDAFKITEEQHIEALKTLEIVNKSGLDAECKFTPTLIYKMQKGWSAGGKLIKIYENLFSLYYDAKSEYFYLRHEGINYPLPENFYELKKYFIRRESTAVLTIDDPEAPRTHVLPAVTIRSINGEFCSSPVNKMQPSEERQIPYGKKIQIGVSFHQAPFIFIIQKCGLS